MSLTLIQTGNGTYLRFKTFPELMEGQESLYARIDIVNENLELQETGLKYAISATEEDFHRQLRAKAAKEDQLITSHSTDPEWNPEGYKKIIIDDTL